MNIINTLKRLLGLDQKTKDSLQAGLEGLAGSGEEIIQNGNKGIDWTTILLSLIIFMAGYSITPFWHNCGEKPTSNPDSSVVVTPGVSDTVFIQGETTYGVIQDTVYVVKDFNSGQLETNLDTTLTQGTEAHIRNTTWYWPNEEGGISFAKSLEWNITERPCQEITQIDTAYVTKYTTPSFWDNRFIPYLGGGVIYNPATKAVDWGVQLGFGIRLN